VGDVVEPVGGLDDVGAAAEARNRQVRAVRGAAEGDRLIRGGISGETGWRPGVRLAHEAEAAPGHGAD
jgi:hypothetical protein